MANNKEYYKAMMEHFKDVLSKDPQDRYASQEYEHYKYMFMSYSKRV